MQAARIFPPEEPMVNGETGHRRTQAERSASTQRALIEAATRLFAERGYAAAGREDIVAAAGVTRGALYHHFTDKADLFRAVYEGVEVDVMGRVAEAAMTADDPVEQLRRGCLAYLDVALDPGVRRICIIDAPAVLDQDVRNEIATASAVAMIRETVVTAIERGRMADQPVDALGHLLLATVMAAAQFVATSEDPGRARQDAGSVIERLLDGLTTGDP
jgi:AcrR family transcriptional regulator